MRAEDNSQMTTLSPASYQIVMTAIKHAKMKGHCQVQPLHVAAALLDPLTRSPTLYNACLQSLEEPSHPLKCDALDLCFKVALDRLPVITDPEKNKDQAMSNALGAALKRAHANERRGTPEQSLQPLLAVKTGIAHLTISILDDPSVSRVFREAGFSSTAVKNNMEEAVAKAALAGPVAPPSLDNSGLRRIQFSMPQFSGARLDSVQFRNSFFPGPFSAGDPSINHMKFLERGRMNGSSNGVDVLAERESPYFATAPLKFLESQLAQKRPEQASRILGRPSFTNRLDTEIRNIVEAFAAGPKKRNPVAVSDSGPNSVLKELSLRLVRGEVPSLRGVHLLDLPFTSLSVGILSQEDFEQKLAKLKRDVDGFMQTGGAIISVGDLQWLLDPSQSIASRLLQELQQLMNSNAHNRLWLLASASPNTMERCRANNHILLDSLGLYPILLAPDSPVSALQPRLGSYYNVKNAEIAFLSQTGGLKAAPIQNGFEKLDCCPDCNSKFQQECSILVKEEQTLCLGSGQSPAYPVGFSKFPWMQNPNDKGRATLPVKEEENLVSHRIEELRQKWQHQCSSTHHVHSGGFTPVDSRDQSVSPVAEIVSPQERNARISLPMLSGPLASKCAPVQSLKIAEEKLLDLAPLHARLARGNMPHFLSSPKPSTVSKNGELETKNGVESGSSPLSWMRRDPINGPTLSMKPNILSLKSGHPGVSVGTDLALGRPSLGPVASTRDLREEGQQPLHSKLQQPKVFRMSSHSGMMRPDTENLNDLCYSLSKAVSWQKEAVGAVAAAVMKCRSGEGRRSGAPGRTDSWLMFLGPDRVGKREVAKALSNLVFGKEESFVLLTGWQPDASGRTPPSSGILAADSNGVKIRGKTPLDRLVDLLSRKPLAVVLLENIECADPVFKKNLTRAIERGKLADSFGKEAPLKNVIIIMTCSAGASLLSSRRNTQGQKAVEFDEEKLSGLGPSEVQLVVDNTASGNVLHTTGKGLSIVDFVRTGQSQKSLKEEKPAESILLFGSPMFKRKADSVTQDEHSRGSRSPPQKTCKRDESSPNRAFSLDLNLSVDENLSEDEEPCITEELCATSAPESVEELTVKVIQSARGECPAAMFSRLDAAVVFKPFNLDDLTDWVLERLESALEDVMHTVKVSVEIDRTLLEVMVTYAWENFPNPDAFQGWVDNVLMRAMSGLVENGSLRPDAVVKVMGVERNVMMTSPMELKVELLPRIIGIDQ
ncbi:unnamed protein product [Calypogeia fissa]